MLENLSILIVEDELLIALELVEAVRMQGGLVLGPAASIAQALVIIGRVTPDAAVLDANLPDGEVTPVAIRLTELNVPFVVYTAAGLPTGLASAARAPPVFVKPVAMDVMLAGLEAEIRYHAGL